MKQTPSPPPAVLSTRSRNAGRVRAKKGTPLTLSRWTEDDETIDTDRAVETMDQIYHAYIDEKSGRGRF